MQKCVTCQFYDRNRAKAATATVAQSKQGQCRRMAPLLHPINSKSYMIEGVWPTVQDDDWCGEWKLVARRADVRTNELSAGGAMRGLQPSDTARGPHWREHGRRAGQGCARRHGVHRPGQVVAAAHSAAAAVPPIAAAATAAATGTHAGDDCRAGALHLRPERSSCARRRRARPRDLVLRRIVEAARRVAFGIRARRCARRQSPSGPRSRHRARGSVRRISRFRRGKVLVALVARRSVTSLHRR